MNSDDSIIYDFNLTALLKLSDLNIRRIAEKNKKLTIGKYFKILSQFLDLAPSTSDAIKEFAGDGSGIKDWKSIKDMIPLLEEMHCDKYIPDLIEIRNACGKGDHRVAAIHARKIDHSFNHLYSQIMSAKITKEEDAFPKADSTILSCLKVLDEKKADHELLVLAVDDSPAILEAVSAVLSKEYKVFKLPKPEMLENVLKQVKPDLFLLDYQMPVLNGFELIPIIRGFDEHKDTPIIFLTAEGTIDNLTAAISLGACDFIVKPFNPDQLREKIAKHILLQNN